MKEVKNIYNRIKHIAIPLFGKLVDKYGNKFSSLRDSLRRADIKILFRTYMSIIVLLSVLMGAFVLIGMLFVSMILKLDLVLSISGMIIIPLLTAFLTFIFLYSWPSAIANSRKRDIEANLPFALVQMASIAESGASPRALFKILSHFKEYGEVSREASKIIKSIEIFGLDEMTAIKNVINKSPSQQFKQILQGMITTIHTGGSLSSYLRKESEKSLFEYRLSRQKYLQVISTLADLYTALLIAAPLLLIAVLAIIAIVGGQVFGMSVQAVLQIGIFIAIPLLNIMFISFLHAIQPKT